MLLGICIQKKNINHYSKPFILNDIDDTFFIAQILRDVDYCTIMELNEIFDISIVIYPEKTSFYDGNSKNLDPSTFKLLGKYRISFNVIKESFSLSDFKKGTFSKKLDNSYDLEINFSTILKDNNNHEYFLLTPSIYAKKSYLTK